jgi:cytochrome b pre-mRNA-processing protein 3
MLKEMIGYRRSKGKAQALYTSLIEQARMPVFFRDFAVPDTIDGRFDMVVAHAWLILSRLNELGDRQTGQALINSLFEGFDEGVRELGVGDIGAGHRVKQMADAFYGRMNAYSTGDLAEAVLRNVFRGDVSRKSEAASIAAYLSNARSVLSRQSLTEQIDFGQLPAI